MRQAIITGIASLGLGIATGLFIRPFIEGPREVTEDDCRKRGFIRPEDCPECPPFSEIDNEADCVRCHGIWIPPSQVPGGECIPKTSPDEGPFTQAQQQDAGSPFTQGQQALQGPDLSVNAEQMPGI